MVVGRLKIRCMSKVIKRLIKHSSWYNSYFKECDKFWNIGTSKYNIVNLGSNSGLYSFDYQCECIDAANWAGSPQSLVADLAILKTYSDNLNTRATILIPLCPFSSLGGGKSYGMHDRYYTILEYKDVVNGTWKKQKEILQIKENPEQFYSFVQLKVDIKGCIKKIMRKRPSVMEARVFDKDSFTWINNWKEEFGISKLDTNISDENILRQNEAVSALKELIEFCMCRNFKPVLVLPPMSTYLSNKFSPQVRKVLIYDFVKKANVQNVPFYDFLDDKEFVSDNFYSNAYLLNETGAKKFTHRLLENLKLV